MKRAAVVATVTALMMLGGVAYAAWLVTGTGQAFSAADTVPAGSTPTAEADGNDVTVEWDAVLLSDGTEVSGYTVLRYDADDTDNGSATTPGANCSGVVTSTSCTENDVSEGDWQYTVTPRQGTNWIGSQGPRSSPVSVGPPPAFIHVAGIDDTSGIQNVNRWWPRATVAVTDANDEPLDGVVVHGLFGNGETDSCVTVDGACELSVGNHVPNEEDPMSFEVTGLDHDDYEYDDQLNDPSPPAITLSRP